MRISKDNRLSGSDRVTLQNLPSVGELGPAMKALSEMQRAFVTACLNMGVGVNNAEAARIAGYSDNGEGAKVTGHRLAHDERVQAAILEEGRKRLRFGSIQATAVLFEALGANKFEKEVGEVPDWKARLSAANSFLDRGGLHALSEHHVTVTTHRSREEKLIEVAKLAKLLGKDPKELLGNLVDSLPDDMKIIEGESVEVGDGK